jgi:hypothetical protein
MSYSSFHEYNEKIVEINEQISKLDKKFKKKINDPKIEKQIEYYKNEIVVITDKTDKNVKLLQDKLQAYTDKIEREIKELKDKEDTYKKSCLLAISIREGHGPEQTYHDTEREELVKERKRLIECAEFHRKNEEELNAYFAKTKQGKKKYFYQGRCFYSESEMNEAIAIDKEASRMMGLTEVEKELEKELQERKRLDDYEKQLEEMNRLYPEGNSDE